MYPYLEAECTIGLIDGLIINTYVAQAKLPHHLIINANKAEPARW